MLSVRVTCLPAQLYPPSPCRVPTSGRPCSVRFKGLTEALRLARHIRLHLLREAFQCRQQISETLPFVCQQSASQQCESQLRCCRLLSTFRFASKNIMQELSNPHLRTTFDRMRNHFRSAGTVTRYSNLNLITLIAVTNDTARHKLYINYEQHFPVRTCRTAY